MRSFGKKEKRLKAYELALKICGQFEKRLGDVLCRELTGYDLSNPEESEKTRNAEILEEKCTDFVRSGVEILLWLV